MSNQKKIVFLTGTRADFGKLKSLIKITQENPNFDVQIFVTGMHSDDKYGFTVNEIYKSGFQNIHTFKNHAGAEFMDRTLAKTIAGFSLFCFAVAGGWYAYDRNRDRNYAHEMSMKKLQFEMEEKKKKADYTREKYLIRNGISDPDANSSVLN